LTHDRERPPHHHVAAAFFVLAKSEKRLEEAHNFDAQVLINEARSGHIQ
jgi:hypothetical protein